MSYATNAIGTVEEVLAKIEKDLAGNSSPEVTAIKDILGHLVQAVEGADKRVSVQANGSHSSGYVQHDIHIASSNVPAPPAPVEAAAADETVADASTAAGPTS